MSIPFWYHSFAVNEAPMIKIELFSNQDPIRKLYTHTCTIHSTTHAHLCIMLHHLNYYIYTCIVLKQAGQSDVKSR